MPSTQNQARHFSIPYLAKYPTWQITLSSRVLCIVELPPPDHNPTEKNELEKKRKIKEREGCLSVSLSLCEGFFLSLHSLLCFAITQKRREEREKTDEHVHLTNSFCRWCSRVIVSVRISSNSFACEFSSLSQGLKMLVANSFDLWRKDAFFSAAEEVQESADIMESAYRAWLRERREKSNPGELNELCRELQTALGTAKWQLEEFERAVRLSYRHLGNDNSATRHRQFISAIESQISLAEAALRESYIEEGKQPLRWVNLDEEERDDLAAFLSGTCEPMQSTKDERMDVTPSMKSSLRDKQVNKENKNANVNPFCNWDSSSNEKTSLDVIPVNKDSVYAIEIKADADSRNSDDLVSQTDRTTSTRKTWSPPNYGALKIVVADEDEQRNKPTRNVDATPKEKGFKPLFWKQKCEEHPQAMQTVNMFNQICGRVSLCRRQFQSPLHLRYGCSIQVKLALMLTIFLIVPFVLYST